MTKPLVIIQARTSSSRLPAKAIMMFRGQPLAVLAANRAATRGDDVVLATSEGSNDDLLVSTAKSAGVQIVRGSLDDVLDRFCIALGTSSDDRIVVRLTGDNILPDGDLIQEVVTELEKTGARYITTTNPESGLPYGLSVEVMRAGDLRAAQREAKTHFEREHVTPWIIDHLDSTVFRKYADLDLSRFRVTIDTFDDLVSMHRIFPETNQPENVPWRKVMERLSKGLYQPGNHFNTGDLVMGTAQLGMPYGINRTGAPEPSEGREMIRCAIGNGVQWLDTARAYGNSEAVIGSVLNAGWRERCRVVTKLSPLTDWGPKDCSKGVSAAAEASLLSSLLALGGRQLDTVLLHRWDHWQAWNGAVAEKLQGWVKGNLIRAIGISVQSPDELNAALEVPAITHVQLPVNLMDHRWDDLIPKIRAARSERGLVVHARSSLLQGLLLSEDPDKWDRAHVADPNPVWKWLRDNAAQYSNSSVLHLCLGWVRALDWIDAVVVGMDNLNQLRKNLEIFSDAPLSNAALKSIRATRHQLSDETLNPSMWRPS